DDPIEADNRWTDPDLHDLRQHLRMQLKGARADSIPERNQPWPYVSRRPASPPGSKPSRLARWFAKS
ncbi:MAG TPA: hydrolase, partial [Mycobacterium sp.]